MTSDGLPADLAASFGLDPGDAERLAALIVDARDRQARALDQAIEGGLRHIPHLLRGAVKAVLVR
jgi:hypothetical protein